MNHTSLRIIVLLIIPLTFAAGCGPKVAQPISVKGSVSLDGQPMPNGKIFFALVGQGPVEMTVTNGSFDGKAMPGMNTVQIGVFEAGSVPKDMPNMQPPMINKLPPQYHAQSKLTADVKSAGPNEFKFEVTSK